jgi:5-methylcytosine-specific restriction enzyme subunit McrC
MVTTKVPVANILTLASLAYRTLLIPPDVGDTLVDSAEPVVDWLAVLLITEVRALIAQGLRQGYVVVEDDLPYVRGRLRFGTTSPLTRPGVMPCEFADFVPDIPENRVLRATLEHLATKRLLPRLRIAVEQLLRRFQNVSFVRPDSRLLNACVITRLNQHYNSALELCGLYLNQAGVELNVGSVGAPAYFFPMEMVFQEAVTAFLSSKMPKVRRQTGGSFQPVAGQPVRQLTFAADIVIGAPPQLVIDTKYAPAEVRNQYGGWSFHNSHVYQAVFYGLSLQCPAVLVYPRTDHDVDVSFVVEDVGVSIITVDLSEPGIPGLVALAERVQEFIPTLAVA